MEVNRLNPVQKATYFLKSQSLFINAGLKLDNPGSIEAFD